MFVTIKNSNHKGNLAEAEIAAAAVRLGIVVLKPLVGHARYDLVFDFGSQLLRVQCKWAPRRGDVVAISLTGIRYTSKGQVRTTYSTDEIDAVAAYCQDVDECYLLPADLIAGMHALNLVLLAFPWFAERLSGRESPAGHG